ncbi:glycoside hydrolase family 13 protein [Tundrisphaera lichenicola]|uniref:glycoside hydrolase family 13 protein n=1 Tax=Tundrisphaera lichenicola TaxID=2029860 RepID=UPI003EBC754F
MSEPQTPDWVRDAIYYQIFPDRFARSFSVEKPAHLDEWGSPPTPRGYQGGDLIGVLEHLDYLGDLGVNAIYFTPIFQSASNHRYHTHDYYRVDPMLGGDPALRRLIDAAHERGMKVVLDGVFNHASRGFFQFHDILENGQDSAYLDWFTVHGWPMNAYDHDQAPGYNAWWGLHALPKFNTDTPAVRRFLWDVARHWIDFGADGWRLDVAHEIDDRSFWAEFRRSVLTSNPEAYIVGEVWEFRPFDQLTDFAEGVDRADEATRWLRGDCWDAVMNYLFTRICFAYFIGEGMDLEALGKTSFHGLDTPGAPAFRRHIEKLLTHYHPNNSAVMMNLLGSHDLARYLHFARGDKSALRLATLLQMTFPGAPSIYYGDEIGLAGGHDPDNRRAFPWDRPETWDRDLFHDFQKFIALRNQRPALRRGSFTFLYAEGDVAAFLRQLDDESVVVVFNTGRATSRVDLPLEGRIAEGSVLEETWSHDSARVEGGHFRQVELAPRSGRVFATPRPR